MERRKSTCTLGRPNKYSKWINEHWMRGTSLLPVAFNTPLNSVIRMSTEGRENRICEKLTGFHPTEKGDGYIFTSADSEAVVIDMIMEDSLLLSPLELKYHQMAWILLLRFGVRFTSATCKVPLQDQIGSNPELVVVDDSGDMHVLFTWTAVSIRWPATRTELTYNTVDLSVLLALMMSNLHHYYQL
ncbi:hypothetical protein CLF_111476 [Clonorchis sinensis]|uniref:Uncharacterized protein n=1 Tax=Clonorchis sinensis TaxID=79923 RepID=G7YUY6_CLOSI|nr:hypothetical protein CLF_111476 [Clonorchis sinensis]